MTTMTRDRQAQPGLAALPPLRPYQREAAAAILRSVQERAGDTITVEVARQGGKNELSAQLELFLLLRAASRGGEAVKCAPTFRPQLQVSMRRLWQRIIGAGLGAAATRDASSVTFGRATLRFLSASPAANVVGHTATLLLEADEAQDIDPEKFDREFRPMAATANTTTVLYGTAWDERTLLERAKQANLEAQRRDGRRRHFEYDWRRVAEANPAYAAYVAHERERLGDDHPVFLTQYCLRPVAGGGRLLSASQLAQIAGSHARLRGPVAGEEYVAGLDLAGGDEAPDVFAASRARTARDATVLTVGRIVYPAADVLVQEPRAEIVEHVAWMGEPHETLLPRVIDLLRNVWRVRRVAVDATGLGETAARLIARAVGEAHVDAVKFSAQAKSQLGFGLLAAVNGGRLKLYARDGSAEWAECQRQCELARVAYRANRTMNFYVDPADGHDDYLVSAALLVHASRTAQRRKATGRVRE